MRSKLQNIWITVLFFKSLFFQKMRLHPVSNMTEENIAMFTISLLATQKQSREGKRVHCPEVSYSFYTCNKGVCLWNLNENSPTHVYALFCELYLYYYTFILCLWTSQHTGGWSIHHWFFKTLMLTSYRVYKFYFHPFIHLA